MISARNGIERALVIGCRIREARDAAGMTNTALAEATGLSRRSVVRIANGHHEPSRRTLWKIAKATSMPIEFFVGRETSARTLRAVEAFVSAVAAEVEEARRS